MKIGPAGSSGPGLGSGGASPGMRSGPCGGVSKGGGDGDGTMGSFGTDTEVPLRSTTWETSVSSVDARQNERRGVKDLSPGSIFLSRELVPLLAAPITVDDMTTVAQDALAQFGVASLQGLGIPTA